MGGPPVSSRGRFFNSNSMHGPLGNAFAALAAKLQNREADLAWPERSKGTKVPAYEEATSSSYSFKIDSRVPPTRATHACHPRVRP
jgi:hypothetical protein